MTSYEGAFNMDNTAMNGGWTNGVLGYQAAGTEVASIGISYDLGEIMLGYTMHTVTNEDDTEAESSSMTLIALKDNATIGLARLGGTDTENTWITLSIRP